MIEVPIIILFAIGCICLMLPDKKAWVGLIAIPAAIYCLGFSILNLYQPMVATATGLFRYTSFNGLIAASCAFFTALSLIYTLGYTPSGQRMNKTAGYMLWSLAFALGAAQASNIIVLLVAWGLSGLALYLLANLTPGAANASKKTFVFIGGSDTLLVLGVAILIYLTNTYTLYDIRLPLGETTTAGVLTAVAFLCLLVAAFAKAGVMPFHTWIPDLAETAPLNVTAFLPAALDKLLGIFLLVLACKQLFVLTAGASMLIVVIGAITVLCGGYMALMQNDMRRLLAYCAVSQVGYMVLGIASGTALGLLAAIFHMLNHALYKSTLFLSAGAVEHRTGTAMLTRLGGIGRKMPATFAVCGIAALSISGIPPFNGFTSKWMIYQSLIERFSLGRFEPLGLLSIAALIAALFGSALTLASFIKMIYAVFLGQSAEKEGERFRALKDPGPAMMMPLYLLTLICLIFTVFPFSIPIRLLAQPAAASFGASAGLMPGLWDAPVASLMMFGGIFLGVVIFLAAGLRRRTTPAFVGGEDLEPNEARSQASDFYRSIVEIGIFKRIYAAAEKHYFDLYDSGTKAALAAGRFLSGLHTGNLHAYLLLILAGMLTLLFTFY